MADWIQYLIIFLLFIAAIGYLYRQVWPVNKKEGCGKGCSCAAADRSGQEKSKSLS